MPGLHHYTQRSSTAALGGTRGTHRHMPNTCAHRFEGRRSSQRTPGGGGVTLAAKFRKRSTTPPPPRTGRPRMTRGREGEQ